MKRLALPLALLALLSAASGCVFYADDDDDIADDDVCAYEGDVAYYPLRDPQTGTCQDFGGGGCWGEPVPVPPQPDWAACYGACEGLDEQSCLATAGCRAAYAGGVPPPDGTFRPVPYWGCWGTAPSGPIQGDSCENLDAYECSRHDNCAAVYWNDGAGIDGSEQFGYCAPEAWNQGCYSDMDCPGGYECTADTECYPPPGCDPSTGEACPAVCYGRCVPAQNGCELIDCMEGYHCELQCYPCDPLPDGSGCESPYCEPICVPDQPNTCADGMVCPEGTHCEEVCSGGGSDPTNGGGCTPEECGYCWSECVEDPHDPGQCDGEVACDSLPPACPDGTVPGISNGCWTGYCIPVEECPQQPPPACEALVTEDECTARNDCRALYTGTGCTCYPDGTCSCETWQFARCETAVTTQPL